MHLGSHFKKTKSTWSFIRQDKKLLLVNSMSFFHPFECVFLELRANYSVIREYLPMENVVQRKFSAVLTDFRFVSLQKAAVIHKALRSWHGFKRFGWYKNESFDADSYKDLDFTGCCRLKQRVKGQKRLYTASFFLLACKKDFSWVELCFYAIPSSTNPKHPLWVSICYMQKKNETNAFKGMCC